MAHKLRKFMTSVFKEKLHLSESEKIDRKRDLPCTGTATLLNQVKGINAKLIE